MSHYNLLIVEDEKELQEGLAKFLGKHYTTDVAENGKDALQQWKNQIYDLLLVDVRMPEMSGTDFIKKIRKLQPYVQIVILSGQALREEAIEAVNAHVHAFLKKPVNYPQLLQSLEDALEKRDSAIVALDNLVKVKPRKFLTIGETEMMAQDLYDELRRGTPFGQKYIRDFRRSLTEYGEVDEPWDEDFDDQEEME